MIVATEGSKFVAISESGIVSSAMLYTALVAVSTLLVSALLIPLGSETGRRGGVRLWVPRPSIPLL